MPELDASELHWEGVVPKWKVHKEIASEVWIADFAPLGNDNFKLAVVWPTEHWFLGDSLRPGTTMLLETVRQVTTLLAHEFYEVPRDYAFVMAGIGIETSAAPYAPDGNAKVVAQILRPGGSQSLARLRSEMTFYVDGEVRAHGWGELRTLHPRAYSRLRGAIVASRESPDLDLEEVSPATVGYESQSDVVVANVRQTSAGWACRLVVKKDHTFFFDHPLDHVPGMLILEAAVQLVRAATGQPEAVLGKLYGDFSSYLEFSRAIDLHLTLGDGHANSCLLRVIQDERVAAQLIGQILQT